jgi:hypothetical protein
MFTKMKVALVLAGSLVAGVAAADTGAAPTKPDHAARKAEMLQKFDTNKDGKLDDKEREAARDAMITERFKKLDTDGNGVLSLSEFKAGKAKFGMRHARGRHGMHRGFRGGDTK